MARRTVSPRPSGRQVVFVGPFGVGKTTAVHTVSDSPVVRATAGTPSSSEEGTRVARRLAEAAGSDCGQWRRGPGGPVDVLAVAGQTRFGATLRPTVAPGSPVVLWLYGQTPYALDEAEEWLEYIAPETEESPLAVAVTRLEIPGDRPALVDYRSVVDRWARGAPLVSADPRDRESVEDVLRAALSAQVAPRPVRR